jgi:predicted transcriptional regulator
MDAKEFRNQLEELGMNQFDFAALAGLSPSAVNRMVNGHSRVAGYVTTILDLTREVRELRATLAVISRDPNLLSRHHAHGPVSDGPL